MSYCSRYTRLCTLLVLYSSIQCTIVLQIASIRMNCSWSPCGCDRYPRVLYSSCFGNLVLYLVVLEYSCLMVLLVDCIDTTKFSSTLHSALHVSFPNRRAWGREPPIERIIRTFGAPAGQQQHATWGHTLVSTVSLNTKLIKASGRSLEKSAKFRPRYPWPCRY